MNVDPMIVKALTGYALQLLPETLLAVAACVLFLAATWNINRKVAAGTAMIALYGAIITLYVSTHTLLSLGGIVILIGGAFLLGIGAKDRHPLWVAMALLALLAALVSHNEVGSGSLTVEDQREASKALRTTNNQAEADNQDAQLRVNTYSSSLYTTRLSVFIKYLALLGSILLVLLSWDEVPDGCSGEFQGCMLLITAGVCLSAAANDLITLFLSLELISIPTYVMLYLPKADSAAQEAAIKYFLLSIFSSAMLLFGFSYLYGLSGTTNIPAIIESLDRSRNSGFSMVALVMILAGLGFKITAVPFHFYAPDVYQGTSTSGAAILSFVPKVAGFLVLIRLLGYVPQTSADINLSVSDHVPVLLWIMAAVTMTLGNVLAFLQDNLKRMLAYSSVAHAGYMLIGLAVTPKLLLEKSTAFTGGVEAIVFYLVAYGAMTIGAFAVLSAISTRERPIDTINDVSGLGRSQPGLALMMTLFLFSLLGLPLTAGFYGKLLLFGSALNLWANGATLPQGSSQAIQPAYLFMILAIIGVVNAAISGFYYLRVVGAMFLGEELKPIQKIAGGPVLASVVLCAFITLAGGIYPEPLRVVIHHAVPQPGSSPAMAGTGGARGEQVAVEELTPVGP